MVERTEKEASTASFGLGLFLLVFLAIAACSRSHKKRDSLKDASVDRDADINSSRQQEPEAGDEFPTDAEPSFINCRRDSDCVSSDPCQSGFCRPTGRCGYGPLADRTPCGTTGYPRICIGGICQRSYCGDGYLDENAGEVCDDGNGDSTDACVMCQDAFCGDGYVFQGVESCEPVFDQSCREDCTAIVCGDGVVDPPQEECEPSISKASCNAFCRLSDSPEWTVEIMKGEEASPFASLLLNDQEAPIVVESAIDSSLDPSNPFVTYVFSFNTQGELIWEWRSAPSNVFSSSAAIDVNNDIVIAGVAPEFATMAPTMAIRGWLAKIDRHGDEKWSVSLESGGLGFIGVTTDDRAAITALGIGTPEMIGTGSGLSPSWMFSDLTLEQFDSEGSHIGTKNPGISGAGVVLGNALSSGTIDGVNRFLLAGVIHNGINLKTLLLLLDTEVSEVWEEPVSYDLDSGDVGFLRALPSNDGEIVVLGAIESEDGELSRFLERFSPDGTPLWKERKEVRYSTLYNDQTTIAPVAPSTNNPMAIDSEDNIVLALSLSEPQSISTSIVIDKYGPDGIPIWQEPLFLDSGSNNTPMAVAVDSSGAIYLLSYAIKMPIAMGEPLTTQLSLHKWPKSDQPEIR